MRGRGHAFMSSAVEEAPLAADRGSGGGGGGEGGGAKSEEESALRATTSICSGDWIFGFFLSFFFLFSESPLEILQPEDFREGMGGGVRV